MYANNYDSPIGKIFLTADDALTGLWFESDRFLPKNISDTATKNLPIFDEVKRWLDIYFSGRAPDFTPPLRAVGTKFRLDVWKIISLIPYGKTMTYGDIAKVIALQKNLAKMSARAIGGAVGHNNISIIIPCHRVIGAGGKLTGYGGGLDKKIKLLELEGVDIEKIA